MIDTGYLKAGLADGRIDMQETDPWPDLVTELDLEIILMVSDKLRSGDYCAYRCNLNL